jgi:hypothetical protein
MLPFLVSRIQRTRPAVAGGFTAPFELLAQEIRPARIRPMKFFAAILIFALFAFFISWGIVEMLKGRPWLLLAAVGVFLGTFIKFGCQPH